MEGGGFSASVSKLDEDDARDGLNDRNPTTSITSLSFRESTLSESYVCKGRQKVNN